MKWFLTFKRNFVSSKTLDWLDFRKDTLPSNSLILQVQKF